MKLCFTKMQGAGNDFIVLDETKGLLQLTTAQYRFLADRHFGIGADQILSVRAAPPAAADIDFSYAIHNADGNEVEHCGNGARCFVRYVREHGLTDRHAIRVQTMNRVLALDMGPSGLVRVDMGAPEFALAQIPFDASGLNPETVNSWKKWPLALIEPSPIAPISIAVLSMGNPHAVLLVDDVDSAPVLQWGPRIESHARFAKGVNAGFMQVLSRTVVRLRVYERGAGETLACGTGACAAVVAGIRLGLLDSKVEVQTRGGPLHIEWQGSLANLTAPVLMSGPAQTVFEGEIELPDTL